MVEEIKPKEELKPLKFEEESSFEIIEYTEEIKPYEGKLKRPNFKEVK